MVFLVGELDFMRGNKIKSKISRVPRILREIHVLARIASHGVGGDAIERLARVHKIILSTTTTINNFAPR